MSQEVTRLREWGATGLIEVSHQLRKIHLISRKRKIMTNLEHHSERKEMFLKNNSSLKNSKTPFRLNSMSKMRLN